MRLRLRAAVIVAVVGCALPGVGSTAQAADFPPNPTTKSGYTLDFQEEFSGTSLDTNRWLPYYLPHWTADREKAKARYTVADGVLTERIDPDTPAWSPEHDGTVRVSSIQSYNKDYWHRFNSTAVNRHEPDFNGYSTMYGYFEIRAKKSAVGGGGHQAFWLVGTQDTSSASRNPEIDFIETFFSKPDTWRIAAYGWGDPNFLSSWVLHESPVPSGQPTQEYHVYGMDWTPTGLNFYYDNQLYKTINDAPNMPMGMILGIYTDAGSGQHNEVWPKSWSVDYIRVFKKDGGYPNSYERMKNHQTGQYMHIENKTGNLQYGAVPSSAWSSQWTRETNGEGYQRFRNRWTGEYLNVEADNGVVHHGNLAATAWSSQWTAEAVGGYLRFKDRWRGKYMHTEGLTGDVQHGTVPSTYWTSQWTAEPAS
ncbi:glycoside hydrolase family 16 protein [Actinokineospora xionganensis]|uniref:Glycoside hydrolase family 16 protein n=1 Tax=Actinokineospora xionganensis TaxID=2684470 RepID=A0ABR7LE94_9PSEU|nr:glycoside hydrolase family 16 protein [Actinokineospora xionganensis]MBC6451030.1 glycoside hydrolase family 16 protein [Actinokineospora xionganensis]